MCIFIYALYKYLHTHLHIYIHRHTDLHTHTYILFMHVQIHGQLKDRCAASEPHLLTLTLQIIFLFSLQDEKG